MTKIKVSALCSILGWVTLTPNRFADRCDSEGLVIGICNETGDWVVLKDHVEVARVS